MKTWHLFLFVVIGAVIYGLIANKILGKSSSITGTIASATGVSTIKSANDSAKYPVGTIVN